MEQFDYIYGSHANAYSFLMVPNELFENDRFDGLSLSSKILYSTLLRRANLSVKNNWVDEQNRVFIIYPNADIMKDLKISEATVIKHMNELKSFGLIEKKKLGQGKPDIIYVKDFIIDDYANGSRTIDSIAEEGTEEECNESENAENKPSDENEVSVCSVQNYRNYSPRTLDTMDSGTLESKGLELVKVQPSYNKYNNNINYISNRIEENTKAGDPSRWYNIVKNRIDYENMIADYPQDASLIDELVMLISEVFASTRHEMYIAKNLLDMGHIKSTFSEIRRAHIEIVIGGLKKTESMPKNKKNYILTSLYNSVSTKEAHLQMFFNAKYGESIRKEANA